MFPNCYPGKVDAMKSCRGTESAEPVRSGVESFSRLQSAKKVATARFLRSCGALRRATPTHIGCEVVVSMWLCTASVSRVTWEMRPVKADLEPSAFTYQQLTQGRYGNPSIPRLSQKREPCNFSNFVCICWDFQCHSTQGNDSPSRLQRFLLAPDPDSEHWIAKF
jgi:hypothetical protein